jgi:hypothetical protein
MKPFLLLTVLTLMQLASFSQISALTQNGEKVILYNNYTWRYADNENIQDKLAITNIYFDSLNIARIEFSLAGSYIDFADGRILYNGLQLNEINYYDFTDLDKALEGKIKSLSVGPEIIKFIYYDSFIIDTKSIGKLKSISLGSYKITFAYYDFMDNTIEGKIKSISSDDNKVRFEYYDMMSMDRNLIGKLKKISGELPGTRITVYD